MKPFVSYELALKLKEKRFDEPCLASYDEQQVLIIEKRTALEINTLLREWVLAPLYQQVIDWFREKHFIWIHIDGSQHLKIVYVISHSKDLFKKHEQIEYSYYEALDKAIEEALKLI